MQSWEVARSDAACWMLYERGNPSSLTPSIRCRRSPARSCAAIGTGPGPLSLRREVTQIGAFVLPLRTFGYRGKLEIYSFGVAWSWAGCSPELDLEHPTMPNLLPTDISQKPLFLMSVQSRQDGPPVLAGYPC